MTMRDNLVLIIGAMKAGTTTLFDHLAAHPQVCGCSPKEPGFFAFDDVYARGSDWYRSLFDFDPEQHSIFLDGSTDYTKWPHCERVLERLDSFGVRPKFIYLMRHPLRRIESHAQHTQFARRELGMNDSPRPDHSLDAGVSDVSLDISRYAQQLDQYRDVYDEGRLLILTLEEMSSDPKSTLRQVCTFLAIDPNLINEELETRNKGATIRRANELHPLWVAARSVEPLYKLTKALLPQSIRDTMRDSTKPKTEVKGRFKLTAQEETSLLSMLAPDLIKLRDVYGIDIEHIWGLRPEAFDTPSAVA